MNPKSKVQSTKSEIDGRTLGIEGRDPDVGNWTLDFGLSATDLRKSFSSPAGERIDVLRGVSFSASAGNVVAIMGASGAGKSTLLHLLGGLEAPDHGQIALGPFAIDSLRLADLPSFRNKHVGLIFQFHHLLPDLSAAENVAMPLIIARRRRDEAMAQAVQSLDKVGLGARIAHPVGHLSGGEQQRVAVCRALIAQPSLVLADEPTGNLDASFVQDIGKTLVSYASNSGAIVIVATHNEELAQLCDRILVLNEGKVSQPDSSLK
jgi:lipoprotein-releasing system ATP-binding protein